MGGENTIDYGSRDWSDASTSQKMPRIVGNTRDKKETRNDPFLECREGAWTFQHLNLGPLAVRTMRV